MDLFTLLAKVSDVILNPLIVLGFVVATIVFFYGIARFIWSADDSGERERGKSAMVWGLVGLFIMFSVYGILRFILATFGIDYDGDLPI